MLVSRVAHRSKGHDLQDEYGDEHTDLGECRDEIEADPTIPEVLIFPLVQNEPAVPTATKKMQYNMQRVEGLEEYRNPAEHADEIESEAHERQDKCQLYARLDRRLLRFSRCSRI